MLSGGWTEFRTVTDQDVALFNEAINGLVGVKYVPLIVATQVVQGTNYKFICNATPVVKDPVTYPAEVILFKPLPSAEEHAPIITGIHPIA